MKPQLVVAYAVGLVMLLAIAITIDGISSEWGIAAMFPLWILWSVAWSVFMVPKMEALD